jgi:hypothetical protein
VGIALSIRVGVMFAMNGHPLLAAQSGREPEHRPKHHIRKRVHRQRPMGQGPVQVDRGRDNRDLG